MPQHILQRMWYQHDGAPAHFDGEVRRHLNLIYPGRWIGRGGPVNWPARSPDLNPLDFLVGTSDDVIEDIEELRIRQKNLQCVVLSSPLF